MDQDRIIAIVNRAGVPYNPAVTRQTQYRAVRFFYQPTERSLNLGYHSPDGPFVADFVFKRGTREENFGDLQAFVRLFGGTTYERDTLFARLKPDFSNELWLVRVIHAYWALGQAPLIEGQGAR